MSPFCSSRVVDGVMILPVLMVMAFPSPSWQGECCVGSVFSVVFGSSSIIAPVRTLGLESDFCNWFTRLCACEAFLTRSVFKVCLRKKGLVFPLPWKGKNGSFEDFLDVFKDELLKDVYLLLCKQPLENIECMLSGSNLVFSVLNFNLRFLVSTVAYLCYAEIAELESLPPT